MRCRGVYLPPHGACFLKALKDARDPGRTDAASRRVLLAHAGHSFVSNRRLMSSPCEHPIAQAPLHGLRWRMDPASRHERLASRPIDLAVLRQHGIGG